MMHELNLPSYDFRVRTEGGKPRIFDEVRKKFVALTPEEWVRQHFIMFLIHHRSTPAGLIIMEKILTMNTMTRRPDILVHDRRGRPLMIIECKAPGVKVTQETFDQVARYNAVLHVPYLVVTNGMVHYCCRMDYRDNTFHFLQDIPDYNEIASVAD